MKIGSIKLINNKIAIIEIIVLLILMLLIV